MATLRKASHALQRRVEQNRLAVIVSLNWAKFEAVVEFKDSPGLFAKGRLFTVGGSGGTLYPPLKVGDVVAANITGSDLAEMLRDRQARRISNPYLYDRSTIQLGLSGFAASGEPAGRKATTPPSPGQWLLVGDQGFELRWDPVTKELLIQIPADGKIYLGGKANAKNVLVHGDANGAGGVSSSQSRIKIGDP